MTSVQTVQASTDVAVGMGQAVFAAEPSRLTTIVGSCVAVMLYSPRRRLGILGHIVLPQSRGGNADHPAKYADTAIPYMLSTLHREGIVPGELTAKIAGGACMFGNGQFSRIGQNNLQAATGALESAGVGITGHDAGGTSGRRVCFDLATGAVTVACVGRPARTI
jgi:chemotaxis protein CheD